jgi:CMP-N-acetylneuraminic acid synthetase
MKSAAFVPMKMNNERLPGKHLLPMPDGRPLLAYALETLSEIQGVSGRFVFCSDHSVLSHVPSNVEWTHRDPRLDAPTAGILDILKAFALAVPADVYVLLHATSPFISTETVETALHAVEHGGYDSALSVRRTDQFLWKDGAPLNYDPRAVPRTQDLSDVLVETTGLYIYSRHHLLSEGRRIGDNPFLLEVSSFEAADINTKVDYLVACELLRSRNTEPAGK